MTSSDAHCVTPAVKAMLQHKNRLMHAGHLMSHRTGFYNQQGCRVQEFNIAA